MTAYTAPAATFDIGRVLNRLFGLLRACFVPLFLANLAIWGVSLVISLINAALGVSSQAFLKPGGVAAAAGMGGVLLVTTLLSIGLFAFQVVLIYASVARASVGEAVTFRGAYTLALRKFWPLLGVGLLSSIGVMAASMLFLVPGIILGLVWAVAAPALVVEGVGVTQAFSRSADLTRGNRGSIFLVNLIVGVLGVVVFYALLFLFVAVFAALGIASGMGAGAAPATPGAPAMAAIIATSSVFGLGFIVYMIFWSALPAALYAELAHIKGGAPTAAADVFT